MERFFEPEKEEGGGELFQAEFIQAEKGIFEKLKGKARAIGSAMALMSALSVMPAFTQEANAGEIHTKEAAAIELLGKIEHIPQQDRATDPVQETYMRKRVAEMYVKVLAAEIKTGNYSGAVQAQINFQDQHTALSELRKAIDTVYGNKDGVTDETDLKEAQEKAKGSPGLEQVLHMFEFEGIK